MGYYSPSCGWNYLKSHGLWLVAHTDPDNGFAMSSSYSAYQKYVSADARGLLGSIATAADQRVGEFACVTSKDRQLFASRVTLIAYLQRGIELQKCRKQVSDLTRRVKDLQAKLPCPTPAPCPVQEPCPTPKPCPACPVCKQPPPCPTCPVCHDCPPCEQSPLPEPVQLVPQQKPEASWGVNLGWLAGGALVGAGLLYFLKMRKR